VGLPAEKIEQRLKDQEEEVLAQLDILDRTFKAWKEMAERAEKTLGSIQESGNAALAEPV
jgi:BMFP domain-containing protein YqiC